VNNKTIWFICAVCVFANTILGQSAAEIKEKFGQPIEAYSVSESIWMTPEFTTDGQVCSMRLYPKRISSTTNYLSNELNKWELKEVIDKIAPLKTRGKRSRFFGFTNFMGQMYSKIYNYENIRFSFLASLNLGRAGIKLTKPTSDKKKVPEDTTPKDEMLIPNDATIVTIVWVNKTCAEK
jgi:hypothetical protein